MLLGSAPLKGAMNWSLYDLADRLRDRGWQVPAYPMPASRQDLVVQRVVVRNTNDLAAMFLRDIRRHLECYRKLFRSNVPGIWSCSRDVSATDSVRIRRHSGTDHFLMG